MERLTQFSQSLTLYNPFPSEIHMKVIKSLVLVAASVLAAGAALADTSVVNMDNINQSQTGNRNTQDLEMGTVNGSAISGGNARVTATNITQSQSGNGNEQSMVLGKIDKDFGNHTTIVTANRVSQFQSGNSNKQHLKVGVIE